jgi:hypothetical protein
MSIFALILHHLRIEIKNLVVVVKGRPRVPKKELN